MKNIDKKTVKFRLKLICIGLNLMCHVMYSYGQLLTSENLIVTITTGTQITVQGDLQNQNAAAITNNGTIDLSGNWTNNASNNVFGTSAGTVIMNGANQTIGGNNSTLFNNLTLLGSGNKMLMVNTSSGGNSGNGVLDIGSRNLILNSKSLTISNPSTGAIAYTSGFITSEQTDNSAKVIWNINATNGVHTIPFGNAAGVQIPFAYNLILGNAGAVTTSTYPTAANNTPLPVLPNAVTHVKNVQGLDNSANTVDRFWQVGVSGTPTAGMTFTWAATENAANGNTIPRAQRWNSSSALWEGPITGQVNPTAQNVTVSNVNAFGTWAVALAASPLPVELISFDAQAVDNKAVLCKWITASEINNDYFTVEHSADGLEFEDVGIVDGSGNSTSVLNYTLTDKNPYNGTSYYRLKQTDFNGTYAYSNVVPVSISKTASSGFMVYPNPAHDQFTAEFSSDSSQDTRLELYDVAGRKVISENVFASEGINTVKIDLSPIASGVYLIEVTSGDRKNVMRLVKK